MIETRRGKGEDFSKTARWSWRHKIRPSEEGYRKSLTRKYGIKKSDIVHAGGFPDFMLITKKRELHFYEVKSRKDKLNPDQRNAIKILLMSKKAKVFLVKYSGKGKQIKYEKPVTLTLKNLRKYGPN